MSEPQGYQVAYVEVPGEATIVTERAVRLSLPDGTKMWVPRCVIENGDEVMRGDYEISVEDWYAVREGLVRCP